MQYFSVKRALKIAGKTYIPCVCYECPEVLDLTVNKLVSEDKAVKYDEKVFFMNGKLLEKTVAKEETSTEETVEETTTEETTEETVEETTTEETSF